MGDSFFELLDESASGELTGSAQVRASDCTNGPWAPGLQHAGPPSALLTRAVRRLGGLPDAALPARLSFDILAPVPVADLVLTARTVRPGRRVALAEASLAAASEPDRPLLLLRAWLLRTVSADTPIPGLPAAANDAAPQLGGHDPMPRPAGWHAGYLDTVEWRWVDGTFEEPGPATVWTRVLVDLVAGEDPDPIERLVAVADSASGISAVASPQQLLFVNTDLTLHLTRPPVGEVIWMHAETSLDPSGVGRTNGVLGDTTGATTRSAQCLFVEPRG